MNVPEGMHVVQAFSSEPKRVAIKKPEFDVQGPIKTKLGLRFLPFDEDDLLQYQIFVLLDEEPFMQLNLNVVYLSE